MATQKRGPGRPAGSKNKSTNSSTPRKTQSKSAAANANGTKTRRAAPKEEPTKTSQNERQSLNPVLKNNIAGLALVGLSAFFIIALQTNVAGVVGETLGSSLKGLFGFGAFLLPYFLILYAVLIFTRTASNFGVRNIILLAILFLMIDLVNGTRFLEAAQYGALDFNAVYANGISLQGGGLFGMYMGVFLYKAIGIYGIYILTFLVIISCILVLLNTPISRLLEANKNRVEKRKEERQKSKEEKVEEEYQVKKERENRWAADALSKTQNPYEPSQMRMAFGKKGEKEDLFPVNPYDTEIAAGEGFGIDGSPLPPQESKVDAEALGQLKEGKNKGLSREYAMKDGDQDEKIRKKDIEELSIFPSKSNSKYKNPPLSLLATGKGTKKKALTDSAREKAIKLESTLKNFGVEARVINVTEGPSVTRYEIQPAIGVKVNSIVRLADDIALNLEARSMRIEAPIPGKAAVGIEIENESREMVTLGDIVSSKEFKASKSKIAFTVGRDIEGRAVIADLQKMPHLLIAGATGSGKSVCINTIITSIIYKASPDEVKLVLIDPKMVELGNYNGIPHLLIPVVTDPKKAASALNWAVGEMTGRYKKFAEEGVRDISSYNASVRAKRESDKVLPQIVVVIDELADLMMVASSVVEDAICRLAQMARAAGMHLIVATQRPSVDVITGLIKANIPSRIAFMVSSQIDSRTILDMGGAEKLVGNGDMLFSSQGTSKPIRVQGPFVTEKEVKNIIEFIIENNKQETEYSEEVIEVIEKGPVSTKDSGAAQDDLIDDAARLVIDAGQASVSMLQRRFRIGYNRAARIIDELKELGVIGPSEGPKARQVLITHLEWEAKKEESKDS